MTKNATELKNNRQMGKILAAYIAQQRANMLNITNP